MAAVIVVVGRVEVEEGRIEGATVTGTAVGRADVVDSVFVAAVVAVVGRLGVSPMTSLPLPVPPVLVLVLPHHQHRFDCM